MVNLTKFGETDKAPIPGFLRKMSLLMWSKNSSVPSGGSISNSTNSLFPERTYTACYSGFIKYFQTTTYTWTESVARPAPKATFNERWPCRGWRVTERCPFFVQNIGFLLGIGCHDNICIVTTHQNSQTQCNANLLWPWCE